MSWNTQPWAASKIQVWVAFRFIDKRMWKFSACPSSDRKPCSPWQAWLGFLQCEMHDKTGDWEPSTMEQNGSPGTIRNGDTQTFLTSLLQILAWFSEVCWLEHGQVQEWSAVGEGATGRSIWSSHEAGEHSSGDFRMVGGAGVISGARLVYASWGFHLVSYCPAVEWAEPRAKLFKMLHGNKNKCGSATVQAVIKSCFERISSAWLGRGKAIFFLSFLSPLNWDFCSLLGQMNYFLFSLQKGF